MGMFDRFIKTEERALENPNAPVSADYFLHIMGWGDFPSATSITVNVDNALGVPAVWSAVTSSLALWHYCRKSFIVARRQAMKWCAMVLVRG